MQPLLLHHNDPHAYVILDTYRSILYQGVQCITHSLRSKLLDIPRCKYDNLDYYLVHPLVHILLQHMHQPHTNTINRLCQLPNLGLPLLILYMACRHPIGLQNRSWQSESKIANRSITDLPFAQYRKLC